MTKTDSVLANPRLTSLGWSTHFMMQVETDELESLMPARLTQIHRSLIAGITPDGPVTVTTKADDSTGDFAVGDWVLINPGGQVERRLERMTLLERRVAGETRSDSLLVPMSTCFSSRPRATRISILRGSSAISFWRAMQVFNPLSC